MEHKNYGGHHFQPPLKHSISLQTHKSLSITFFLPQKCDYGSKTNPDHKRANIGLGKGIYVYLYSWEVSWKNRITSEWRAGEKEICALTRCQYCPTLDHMSRGKIAFLWEQAKPFSLRQQLGVLSRMSSHLLSDAIHWASPTWQCLVSIHPSQLSESWNDHTVIFISKSVSNQLELFFLACS